VLDVERITDDYQALAALLRPAITPTQAKEAVELLLLLNMIVRDETGVLHPTHASILPATFGKGRSLIICSAFL
jgi:hypothetical protein